MNVVPTLAILAAVFLAMPWLTIAFTRYCDTVNRLMRKRAARADGSVCRAYKPPTTAETTGLCARCGMWDYKHQERTHA